MSSERRRARVLKGAATESVDPGGDVLSPAWPRPRWVEDQIASAYQAGLAAGRAETLARRDGDLALLSRALDAALDGLAAQLCADQDHRVEATTELAVDLSRWILRRELSADTHAGLDRLRDALAAVPRRASLTLHVAPSSVEMVTEAVADRDAIVRPDPALSPGELRVQFEHGDLDATFATAFARARAQLEVPESQDDAADDEAAP